MRLVVAMELRGRCGGAVAWALTLAQRGDHELYGVHVAARADAVALARRALHEFAEDCGAAERFTALRAEDADDVPAALADACAAYHADALVLGRHAPRRGAVLNRLGFIARRLIRSPPAPVFVVAPDFTADTVGGGPILAATDLADESVEACRFAATVGKVLSRQVQLVHVAESTAAWATGPLGPLDLRHIDADACAHARAAVTAFAKRHGLPFDKVEILQGDPIDELTRHVRDNDPTALVVGSRRLGVLARIFTSSVGIELAGNAPCPVAVVPPVSGDQ